MMIWEAREQANYAATKHDGGGAKRFSMTKLVSFPSKEGFLVIISSTIDDLALKLEWYEIRDGFCDNGKNQDVMLALELTPRCTVAHRRACWSLLERMLKRGTRREKFFLLKNMMMLGHYVLLL